METLDVLLERLRKVKARYDELDGMMLDPVLLSDKKGYAKIAKEQASLRQVVEAYDELSTIVNHLEEAEAMLKEDDAEMREMAQLEIETLSAQRDALSEKLHVLLIPKDPNDDHGAIVEIRGAAGGDEGNIFAGDLFRMYTRYCEMNRFKTEVLEASDEIGRAHV